MADLDRESDDQLLAVAAEDAASFSAFYRRYEPAMLAYFVRRVGDPELAGDLTMEVFAAVLVACARYRPGQAPAQAWLFAIARHKLANSRRRRRVEDRARRRLGMAPVVLEDEDLERWCWRMRIWNGSSVLLQAAMPRGGPLRACLLISERRYSLGSLMSGITERSRLSCAVRRALRVSASVGGLRGCVTSLERRSHDGPATG
jgi:RNA polymerase sigma factor (sigma-70 family)